MAKMPNSKKSSSKVQTVLKKAGSDFAYKSNNTIDNKSCCMGGNCYNCKICRSRLDDQVKIIFGIVVIIFIILGYHVSSSYFYATAILAAFYVLSGFTGMCYIKKLLKCIPCNKNKDDHNSNI